jgi:hypothetical protein
MRGLVMSARDRDTLALPAGKTTAAFADHGVVTFGQLEDEVMSARERCRRNDELDGHSRIGERDILANGAVEEHVLLQDDADLAPKRG